MCSYEIEVPPAEARWCLADLAQECVVMKLKYHRLKPGGVFMRVQSTKIKKPSTTRRQHVTIPTDACCRATCHPNLQFTSPSLRIHSGRNLWCQDRKSTRLHSSHVS